MSHSVEHIAGVVIGGCLLALGVLMVSWWFITAGVVIWATTAVLATEPQ